MERVAAEGALVPTIWYWEVANSLVMRCRRGLLGPSDVPDILRELGALPIALIRGLPWKAGNPR